MLGEPLFHLVQHGPDREIVPLHLGHDLEETGQVTGLEASAEASPNEPCDLAFRNSESHRFERLVPDERLRLGRELGSLQGP